MGPGFLLRQLVLGPAHDDVALVADVGLQHLPQRQRARHAVDQRHHVDAERRLHVGVLEQLVQHDLRQHVALELDHQAHAPAVGLVADVADLGDLLVPDELGDLDDQPALAALLDLVGQLGDDDRLLALGQRLDVRLGLDPDLAATGRVGVADPLGAEDDAAGREVRPLEVLHQPVEVDVRVVDERDRGVDRLADVVRRDLGRHADGDARGAVDEQVRVPRRQDRRLGLAPVVVRGEVDRVHVQVAKHLHREPGEAGLGVPHGRGGVVVDRAEVALTVDERVAHREVLGQADQRLVDRGVAVRVVVAHHLADDARALRVAARRTEAQLRHAVEDPAVDRLEAVPDVRQRPPDDHGHRVVQVRGPHLVFERAGLDVAAADHFGSHGSGSFSYESGGRLGLRHPGSRPGGRAPR